MGLYEVLGKAGIIKDAPIEEEALDFRLEVKEVLREGAKKNPMKSNRLDKFHKLKARAEAGLFVDFENCEEKIIPSSFEKARAEMLMRQIEANENEPIKRIIRDVLEKGKR